MDTPHTTRISRAAALRRIGASLLVVAFTPRAVLATARRGFKHPEPRPGITAANVLSEEKLAGRRKKVKEAFAVARKRPAIFDGVLCPCHCEGQHRSLLVCFETDQPTGCLGCREAAMLVEKHAAKGASLAEIRKAIDDEWGRQ